MYKRVPHNGDLARTLRGSTAAVLVAVGGIGVSLSGCSSGSPVRHPAAPRQGCIPASVVKSSTGSVSCALTQIREAEPANANPAQVKGDLETVAGVSRKLLGSTVSFALEVYRVSSAKGNHIYPGDVIGMVADAIRQNPTSKSAENLVRAIPHIAQATADAYEQGVRGSYPQQGAVKEISSLVRTASTDPKAAIQQAQAAVDALSTFNQQMAQHGGP